MAEYPLINGSTLGRGHRWSAIAVAALISALAITCLPFGRVQLASYPGFMPAFGAISLLVDGLTAVLLLAQARLARRRSDLRLGAAYLFSALVTLPHLMAFPGVFAAAPLIGSNATAVWLWVAWHAGFAVCVSRCVLARERVLAPTEVVRTIAGLCLAAAGVLAAATLGLPWLPRVIDGNDFSGLWTTGVGPAVLGLTLCALALVIARLRCRGVLAAWLTVALLAASLDAGLTLSGAGRFSVGWYAARILSLMTGVCVLFALLSELMREAGRVAEANESLERMLRTDVLTGLANRRAFDLALDAEWRRAQREQTAISLLMVDIDYFKGFNDHYGHPAGDGCLRLVGGALAGQAYRPGDVAARIGGEEFGIILPVTEEGGAFQVAERIRASVAALALPHDGCSGGTVTISVGAATVRPFTLPSDAGQLVSDADHALYRAKAAGRNTVCGADKARLVLTQA